jgi:hypothetical protein
MCASAPPDFLQARWADLALAEWLERNRLPSLQLMLFATPDEIKTTKIEIIIILDKHIVVKKKCEKKNELLI